jgi:hypothetical protein
MLLVEALVGDMSWRFSGVLFFGWGMAAFAFYNLGIIGVL